jgi:hypothetical protein
MFVHSHDHRHHRRFFYACMVYHLRGRAICKNNLESPMETTDEAVLDSIESDVLRVEVLETSLAKALDILQPGDHVIESRVDGLRAELVRLDGEIARLTGAIAVGGELAGLLAALQERERRRHQVRTELAAVDRITDRAAFDLPKALQRLRGALTDWQGMLRAEPPAARQALLALLAGRLVFTPRGDGGDRHYEFEGPATIGKLFAGIVLPKGVVTPAGFEPAISTLKGSRPVPG